MIRDRDFSYIALALAIFICGAVLVIERRKGQAHGQVPTWHDMGGDGNRPNGHEEAGCSSSAEASSAGDEGIEGGDEWLPAPVPLSQDRVLDAGRSGVVRVGGHTATYEVTAYCPCSKCCGDCADGITASGFPVSENGGCFVAADKSLPFGTMIRIPGYNGGKPVPVLDRGGAIEGRKIDVFFPTHQAALAWGRQTLICEVQR